MISVAPRRILVTGAGGYIGSFLVERLVEQGVLIRVLARSVFDSEAPNVEVATGDILQPDDLRRAMQGMDVVFHLAGSGSPASPAGQHPELIRTNVTGTLNVLNAASEAGVKRLVFASSAAIYGDTLVDQMREGMPLNPSSTYGVTKIAAEQLCSMFHRNGALETVSLRIFNVYGPRQSGKFIPNVVKSLKSGEAIVLRGDGQQTRDFVYIDDVCEALMRAGNFERSAGEVLNVGTGRPVPILEVIERVGNHLGITPKLKYESPIEGEVLAATADTRRIRETLGWCPGVSIERGIAMSIAKHWSFVTQRGAS